MQRLLLWPGHRSPLCPTAHRRLRCTSWCRLHRGVRAAQCIPLVLLRVFDRAALLLTAGSAHPDEAHQNSRLNRGRQLYSHQQSPSSMAVRAWLLLAWLAVAAALLHRAKADVGAAGVMVQYAPEQAEQVRRQAARALHAAVGQPGQQTRAQACDVLRSRRSGPPSRRRAAPLRGRRQRRACCWWHAAQQTAAAAIAAPCQQQACRGWRRCRA